MQPTQPQLGAAIKNEAVSVPENREERYTLERAAVLEEARKIFEAKNEIINKNLRSRFTLVIEEMKAAGTAQALIDIYADVIHVTMIEAHRMISGQYKDTKHDIRQAAESLIKISLMDTSKAFLYRMYAILADQDKIDKGAILTHEWLEATVESRRVESLENNREIEKHEYESWRKDIHSTQQKIYVLTLQFQAAINTYNNSNKTPADLAILRNRLSGLIVYRYSERARKLYYKIISHINISIDRDELSALRSVATIAYRDAMTLEAKISDGNMSITTDKESPTPESTRLILNNVEDVVASICEKIKPGSSKAIGKNPRIVHDLLHLTPIKKKDNEETRKKRLEELDRVAAIVIEAKLVPLLEKMSETIGDYYRFLRRDNAFRKYVYTPIPIITNKDSVTLVHGVPLGEFADPSIYTNEQLAEAVINSTQKHDRGMHRAAQFLANTGSLIEEYNNIRNPLEQSNSRFTEINVMDESLRKNIFALYLLKKYRQRLTNDLWGSQPYIIALNSHNNKKIAAIKNIEEAMISGATPVGYATTLDALRSDGGNTTIAAVRSNP